MDRLPPIAREILTRLLDRYERPDRDPDRVMRVRLSEVPDYAASARHEVNAALIELVRQGLITVQWVKHETDNWLDKVDLNLDRVEALYALLKRRPRRDQVAALHTLIDAQTPASDWHVQALSWLRQQLDTYHSIAPFQLDDPRFNTDLLDTFNALAQLQTPLLERTFSVQLFGDSKRFEDLRPAVLTVLRRHSPYAPDHLGDDDSLLRAHLLQRVPEYVLLCGPLALKLTDTTLPLTLYPDGLSLPATTLRAATVLACPARAVITIENATSYHELISLQTPDVLHLFTGGFASPTVIALLQAIRSAQPALPLYHWGDLDAGGFRILLHLRKQLGEVKSLVMNEAAFTQYQRWAQPLTANDRVGLTALRANAGLQDCAGVIGLLLATDRKLEQEAVAPRYAIEWLNKS
jgi:hypothetical protein